MQSCEEIRGIMEKTIGKGGPAVCTRDERLAVVAHYQQCPACRAFVDGNAARDRERPGYDPVASRQRARELVERDLRSLRDEQAGDS